MLIYLMRHGQTAFNRETPFRGSSICRWTAKGARSRSARGQDENITGVTRLYCSRQLRARTTAGLVGKSHGPDPGAASGAGGDPRGPLGGKIADELRAGPEGALVGRFLAGDVEFVIPGGESVPPGASGARPAALLPLLDEAEGDAAVVAHGVS